MTEPFELNTNGLQVKGEFRHGSPMVIFSHGFGVERTSAGMFTDIANALPQSYGYILFDYYEIGSNRWAVPGIDAMSKMLCTVYEHAISLSESILIIAHSQGSTITALSEITVPTIFLAPPTRTITGPFKENFVKHRAGRAQIDENGSVRMTRKRDGKELVIHDGWFNQSVRNNAFEKMRTIARRGELTIIEALHDEQIKDRRVYDSLEKLGAHRFKISADHNFTGDSRAVLLKTLAGILAS